VRIEWTWVELRESQVKMETGKPIEHGAAFSKGEFSLFFSVHRMVKALTGDNGCDVNIDHVAISMSIAHAYVNSSLAFFFSRALQECSDATSFPRVLTDTRTT
jgi:hypothetical protein